MVYLVKVGLFEEAGNTITCLKLAERLDKSMTNSPAMRAWIGSKNVMALNDSVNTCHDSVMTQPDIVSACHELEVEKIRLEKIRKEKPIVSRDTCNCPVEEITSKYNEICKSLPEVKILSDKRKKAVRARWKESDKHQSIEFWERYFHHIEASDFLTGRSGKGAFGFDWIFNPANFVKIIEGNYVNREYQQ